MKAVTQKQWFRFPAETSVEKMAEMMNIKWLKTIKNNKASKDNMDIQEKKIEKK